MALVQKLRPGYEPWTTPVWEPPSSEIASLLFALQAALGAGFLGYYFGVRHAEAKAKAGARRSDNARD
jgi:cobalt/nickel transport protein